MVTDFWDKCFAAWSVRSIIFLGPRPRSHAQSCLGNAYLGQSALLLDIDMVEHILKIEMVQHILISMNHTVILYIAMAQSG